MAGPLRSDPRFYLGESLGNIHTWGFGKLIKEENELLDLAEFCKSALDKADSVSSYLSVELAQTIDI